MRSFMLGTLAGGCAVALLAYILWPAPASAPLAVVNVPTAGLRVPPPLDPPVALASAASALATAAAPPPPAAAPLEPAAMPVAALSAEHARMLLLEAKGRPPTLPELHAVFVNEGKDPAWSLAMEQSINQVLAATHAPGDYQIMSVDCRVSMCEVLAFGSNASSPSQGWNQAIGEMRKEPWYSDISGESTSMGSQNGRFTVATILQRKKP